MLIVSCLFEKRMEACFFYFFFLSKWPPNLFLKTTGKAIFQNNLFGSEIVNKRGGGASKMEGGGDAKHVLLTTYFIDKVVPSALPPELVCQPRRANIDYSP